MATARDLITVLGRKSNFEAVDLQEGPTQVRIMGRVRSDGTNANIANWLLVVSNLLARLDSPGCPWKIDISKSYFRKSGKVVYAWRILLQAPGADVRTMLPDVIATVQGAPQASHVTVDEVPLLGSSQNRNSLTRGKGAGSVLNAPPIAALGGQGFNGGR